MPVLHWLTRDEDVAAARVPYRLLEEVPGQGASAPAAGNMLIQGDNLEALKALLPFYAGSVKCIYIDPPYNTRSAFAHYDDNLEHSRWLAMMWPRLQLLRELLAEDGSIRVSIDDNEAHDLKVTMDEVFGRRHFIDTVIWRKTIHPSRALATFRRTMIISSSSPNPPTLSGRNRCPGPKGRTRHTEIPTTTRAGRGRRATFRQPLQPWNLRHRHAERARQCRRWPMSSMAWSTSRA